MEQLGFDSASTKILNDIMSIQGLKLVSVDDTVWIKSSNGVMVELKTLDSMTDRSRCVFGKERLDKFFNDLGTVMASLKDVQNNNLNKRNLSGQPCSSYIAMGGTYNQDLMLKYLFEKTRIMEIELDKLKNKQQTDFGA